MNLNLQQIAATVTANKTKKGLPPVEFWNPEFCGEMDLVIRADGSWWHEGTPFTRQSLVRLFASILRKDADGETYLVTPIEKIRIRVERAAFIAIRVDSVGKGLERRLFFTTNMGETIELSSSRPLRVETDPKTLQPAPFLLVRGRLEAILTRSVFYELVSYACEREVSGRKQLGVYGQGIFFPLGPAGIHEIDANEC